MSNEPFISTVPITTPEEQATRIAEYEKIKADLAVISPLLSLPTSAEPECALLNAVDLTARLLAVLASDLRRCIEARKAAR